MRYETASRYPSARTRTAVTAMNADNVMIDGLEVIDEQVVVLSSAEVASDVDADRTRTPRPRTASPMAPMYRGRNHGLGQ